MYISHWFHKKFCAEQKRGSSDCSLKTVKWYWDYELQKQGESRFYQNWQIIRNDFFLHYIKALEKSLFFIRHNQRKQKIFFIKQTHYHKNIFRAYCFDTFRKSIKTISLAKPSYNVHPRRGCPYGRNRHNKVPATSNLYLLGEVLLP